MTAGADKPVKLEGRNHRIIEILSKLIVIFDKNRYHSPVQYDWRQTCCCGTAGRLCEGVTCCRFVTITMITKKVPERLICWRMHQINPSGTFFYS